MYIETPYNEAQIGRTPKGIPELRYQTTQLRDVPDSTIRFVLHSNYRHHQGQAYLDIMGFGDSLIIAYFDPSSLMVLGQYEKGWLKKNTGEEEIHQAIVTPSPDKLMTLTGPFTHSDRFPQECVKSYDLLLPPTGRDKLRIRAENREGALDEVLTIILLKPEPNMRAVQVATLVRNIQAWEQASFPSGRIIR